MRLKLLGLFVVAVLSSDSLLAACSLTQVFALCLPLAPFAFSFRRHEVELLCGLLNVGRNRSFGVVGDGAV